MIKKRIKTGKRNKSRKIGNKKKENRWKWRKKEIDMGKNKSDEKNKMVEIWIGKKN